jgi:hypothetical protein
MSPQEYLMRHILHVLSREQRFGCVVAFTPTKFVGDWSSILGDKNVLENYNELWIKALLDAQARLVKKGKASSILLIFDDGLGSINYQSQMFQKLASTSRHYKISLWFAMQQYHKCPKIIRSNTDYLFVLNNVSESNCKAIFDEFPPCPKMNMRKWHDLQAYSQAATQNHGVMMLDNSTSELMIYQMRAPAKEVKYKLKQSGSRRP